MIYCRDCGIYLEIGNRNERVKLATRDDGYGKINTGCTKFGLCYSESLLSKAYLLSVGSVMIP